MFNIATIQNSLTPLVGFSQNYRKDVDRLDADLCTSIAGSYINQQAHPLLTMENINLLLDIFRNTDVVAYDAAQPYVVGDIVVSVNLIYYCIQAGAGQTPASKPLYWTKTNLISAYMRRTRLFACNNLFESVFSERKLHMIGKTTLTDTSLYDGTGSLANTIPNLSRFVGFMISPKNKDTVINISSIGLQLSAPAPNLPIYVYQTSSAAPYGQVVIDHEKTVTFAWHEVQAGAIQMYFNSQTVDDACPYFIGYYQDDLPVGCLAIWKQIMWNYMECGTCNTVNDMYRRRWSNFFDIQPIYVENTWLNEDRTFWELDKTTYVSNQNFGMNLKIQVNCDVSDFICRNRLAFTKGLKMQIVHDLINAMAYSDRDNQRKESVSQKAFYALRRDDNAQPGIIDQLKNEIKNVNFDIQDISSICLPCVKGATGVRTKSAFK